MNTALIGILRKAVTIGLAVYIAVNLSDKLF